MNKVNDPISQAASQTEQGRPAVAVKVPEQPTLAANVQLIGELQEGGFKDRQWFIQRNGRFLQLPELLYRVAEQLNGERTLEEIAAGVTQATDWIVSPDDVRHILQTKLIPLRLVAMADGSVVLRDEDRAHRPFGFKGVKVLGPRIINPITRVLQFLYTPLLFVPILILIVIAHGWLYFVHGVAGPLHDTFYTSGQLLVEFVIWFLACAFHEFGHASALRYGGGRVRGMGVGLYLIYPIFYTDVTDSYRLGRWARLRTDIGGFYFQFIFALGALALYFVTRQGYLLLIMVLTDLALLAECSPLVRFDGYWVLADLTGIPDLFSQAGPFLRSVFSQTGPFLRSVFSFPALVRSKLPNLKPWVKVVFVCYIIAAIFGLPFLLFSLLIREPQIVAYTWGALLYQGEWFMYSQRTSDRPGMVLTLLQALFIAIGLCGNFYVLYLAGRRAIRAVWHWSKHKLKRRIAAALVIAGFIVLIAYFWTPQLQLIAK